MVRQSPGRSWPHRGSLHISAFLEARQAAAHRRGVQPDHRCEVPGVDLGQALKPDQEVKIRQGETEPGQGADMWFRHRSAQNPDRCADADVRRLGWFAKLRAREPWATRHAASEVRFSCRANRNRRWSPVTEPGADQVGQSGHQRVPPDPSPPCRDRTRAPAPDSPATGSSPPCRDRTRARAAPTPRPPVRAPRSTARALPWCSILRRSLA